MGRDSDRRRRRPSHSSSRDARSVLQREDVRTSVAGGSDYHGSGRHGRTARNTVPVMPQPPPPPPAAAAAAHYAAPPPAPRGHSYRTRRADGQIYETEIQRSVHVNGAERRRRKSEMSADQKYRQMRVSTGLTSSSDQGSEDDSDDEVLNRRSDVDEESASESEDEESDDSSPTRRRGHRRDVEILSSSRQVPEPEQESSDDSDLNHNGAQLARTPSNSSGPADGHYRTPESQRRRPKLIEAPPASIPRSETMPYQRTPPRRKPERRRAQSEILDDQPRRSIRRHSRKSEPIVMQQEISPRKPKRQVSRGDSLRSNSNHRSSVLSSIISGSSDHRGSSRKRAVRPKEKGPVPVVDCVVCMDGIKAHKAHMLKCNHYMCRSCIVRPFEMSLKDPKQMPPKCCDQRISLRHVEPHFDLKFKKKWNRKYEEYTTDNRLYCPNTACGDWIHPSQIHLHKNRERAKCTNCGTKVCVDCNGVWHSSPDCPEDEELQEFLKQAKEEGWTRCYRCKIMVDRKEGCNHMTCRCGAEFCMLCGSKWKSCDCEWFNFEPIDDLNDYYEGPGHMDDIFDSDDAPPTRNRTYSQQMRRRRAQEHHDEELARRMQYDMSLEQDSDDDEYGEEYHMSGGAGDSVGLGIAPGHHDYGRSNTGRHRTRMRGSPVSYEHTRQGSGHKTPPRSAHYNRGSYISEVGRSRGVRGSDRGDSMERRLAERLSEQRVPQGPPQGPSPMHMPGYGPSHMSPAAMMSQSVAPAPMGPYPPSAMRMPMHSMPMPSSPPMMAAPPHHAFGSFPPHQAVPVHQSHSYPRGGMPEFDEDGPRSAAAAGLGSTGGGKDRVAQWATHVAPGPPDGEKTMGRRSNERLSRVKA